MERKPNDQKQFDFLGILAILSFVFQIENYQLNSQQTSNDELMQEMRIQDSFYWKKIVEQNEEIIQLLGG